MLDIQSSEKNIRLWRPESSVLPRPGEVQGQPALPPVIQPDHLGAEHSLRFVGVPWAGHLNMLVADESPEKALQSSWRWLAAGLPDASFWMGSASPRRPPSLLFQNQCKSDCGFMFVHLFVVCLFEEPGKLPDEEKLLTHHAAISVSNLECCPLWDGNLSPAELWHHLCSCWACFGTRVCVGGGWSWSCKVLTFCRQQE